MDYTTVKLQKLKIADGSEVEYARVLKQRGTRTLGQSVMLWRLTPQQLEEARRAQAQGKSIINTLGQAGHLGCSPNSH